MRAQSVLDAWDATSILRGLNEIGTARLAVALALQPTLTNLFAGFYITLAGQLRVNDYVELETGQKGYVVDIGAPLENFPTDDLQADTARLMAALTDYVRDYPDQYCWIHQRFKGRPAPYPDIYRTEP